MYYLGNWQLPQATELRAGPDGLWAHQAEADLAPQTGLLPRQLASSTLLKMSLCYVPASQQG